ncbi:hypothetical protein BJX68DRAFT_260990 [Aspergillus pseudodeflectus]|uniref:Uncharacterized protein n=1 Tax=Aspergillus pseudodeflectus TaxID=176178 RepID=A0ABR4L690_9EURO
MEKPNVAANVIAVGDGLSKLRRLEQELSPGKSRMALSRVDFRTLKWLVTRNNVERTAPDLGRCTQAVCLVLPNASLEEPRECRASSRDLSTRTSLPEPTEYSENKDITTAPPQW